ncbi:MAG: FAD-dependent oxidoreductase [Meiothermus sp.]|nr:FAD-dependent oxidoreductase [Meiothermus sp.]
MGRRDNEPISDFGKLETAELETTNLNKLLPRKVTRRDFLEGTLLTGAMLAGFVQAQGNRGSLRGEQFALAHAVRDGAQLPEGEATGERFDAVVVGGGMSGLCAAWNLKKRGFKVLVLEKEAVAGGNARRDFLYGVTVGLGAAYTVYPYNRQLTEFYTAMGTVARMDGQDPVIRHDLIVPEPGNLAYVNGRWVEDPWNHPERLPLPRRVREGLKTLWNKVNEWSEYTDAENRFAFDTPTDASSTDPKVRALDKVSFAAYVNSLGLDSQVARFWDFYGRSSFGLLTGELSAWAMLNFLTGETLPNISQPGGNAWLAHALRKTLANQIRAEAFVYKIEEAGGGARVQYMVGGKFYSLEASRVILATPKHIGRRLSPLLADLPRFRYNPYLVVNVVLENAPRDGYDHWIHQNNRLVVDFIDAGWVNRATGPKVYTCYCPLPEARRAELLTRPFEFWAEQVVGDLEAVRPGLKRKILHIDLWRWGHPFVRAVPGFIFGERMQALKPRGPIHLAHNDSDGLPAFENALSAGLRASAEVAQALKGR